MLLGKSNLLLWLAVWGGVLFYSQAHALITTPAEGCLELRDFSYREDRNGRLGIADVRSDPLGWQQARNAVFNRGFSNSAWWLKFDISNARQNQTWLLEIGYPLLDDIEIYVLDEAGQQTEYYRLGDRLPFADRPIETRYFTVPLTIPTDSTRQVLLRIQSTSAIEVPLMLWHPDRHYHHTLKVVAIEGICYGGLIIVAFYNLAMFATLRQRVYLYYVSYIISMILFNASMSGWSFMLLWPDSPDWNNTSVVFLLCCLAFCALLFIGRLLQVSTDMRIFDTTRTAGMTCWH